MGTAFREPDRAFRRTITPLVGCCSQNGILCSLKAADAIRPVERRRSKNCPAASPCCYRRFRGGRNHRLEPLWQRRRGLRYSAAALISADNVTGIRQQWIFRTGDLARRPPAVMRRIKFQTTPILAGGKLVFCSSFNEVIALDPGTGTQAWRFDPQVATDIRPANRFNCRGVAQWRDPQASAGAMCALRILSAT